MIGFDTAALIDLFRNDTLLVECLSSLDDTAVFTRINYLELMFGIDLTNPKHIKEKEYFDALFDNSQVLELDSVSSKKAGEIFSELKKKGALIEPFDCAIAGIYLSNGVTKIITRNVKHFERVKELEVLSY